MNKIFLTFFMTFCMTFSSPAFADDLLDSLTGGVEPGMTVAEAIAILDSRAIKYRLGEGGIDLPELLTWLEVRQNVISSARSQINYVHAYYLHMVALMFDRYGQPCKIMSHGPWINTITESSDLALYFNYSEETVASITTMAMPMENKSYANRLELSYKLKVDNSRFQCD